MIHRKPLSWYVDKLNAGEPFTSLLYGDGEFLVASRRRTGREMQNGETVTPQLEDEMQGSYLAVGHHDVNPIYRATDPFLADPASYGGQDKASVYECARSLKESLPTGASVDWYDGTVWDTAVRDGELHPLVEALSRRDVAFVGNREVHEALPFLAEYGTNVPDRNACGQLDAIEARMMSQGIPDGRVVVVCMGVGAIPLIMRLRRRFPGATYLDLGSTFDVFAKKGGERGWRAELYADEAKWQALVDKNRRGT